MSSYASSLSLFPFSRLLIHAPRFGVVLVVQALFLAFLVAAPCRAQEQEQAKDQGPAATAEVKLPAREKFHLYLLTGQSNMAGRGTVEAQDKVPHPRVVTLSKEGKWVPAVDPLHYDKSAAGVGPGRTFAIALAEVEKDKDVMIGLIPAACGGSAIRTWTPGAYHGQTKSHPYDDAMARARLALKDGTLKGILWHQGEADSGGSQAEKYKGRLKALIERFRQELESPALPFIIGQLGLHRDLPVAPGRQIVNDAQEQLAVEMDFVGFVPSAGLTFNSDNVHLDAASQREFGRRYAKVYLEVVQKAAPASAK